MHTETKKPKILVVDDETDMQIFLSNILEAGGFSPVVASSGTEGFQKAKREDLSLIILAVPMPEKKGVQMYRELKLNQKLKDIPVIMISTIDRRTFFLYQKTQLVKIGQDIAEPEAYLGKPPEADELLFLIRNILKKEKT